MLLRRARRQAAGPAQGQETGRGSRRGRRTITTMRRVLVTGASRRRGIGQAIVRRVHGDGHRVAAHTWSPYDATEPWGADDEAPLTDLPDVPVLRADLADPAAPERLVADAATRVGTLDALVVNHARSPLGLSRAVEDAGGPADITVVCVDVPGCEQPAILAKRHRLHTRR